MIRPLFCPSAIYFAASTFLSSSLCGCQLDYVLPIISCWAKKIGIVTYFSCLEKSSLASSSSQLSSHRWTLVPLAVVEPCSVSSWGQSVDRSHGQHEYERMTKRILLMTCAGYMNSLGVFWRELWWDDVDVGGRDIALLADHSNERGLEKLSHSPSTGKSSNSSSSSST